MLLCKIWTVPDLVRKRKGKEDKERERERYTDTHSINRTYSIHILYAATEVKVRQINSHVKKEIKNPWTIRSFRFCLKAAEVCPQEKSSI